MSESIGPETSAIERMLHDRTRQAVPSALRTRVLAAVSDVLPKKVPATKYGKAAQRDPPEYADLVAGTFFLSLLLVATLPLAAALHHDGPTTNRHLLSFAQRAEAAGIALDMAGPSTTQLAGRDVRIDDGGRPRDILRSIDARSFLQGEL